MCKLGPASTYELKPSGLQQATSAWTLASYLNRAAENPVISNNPITFSSDSAAQIQGWICGLARFTNRLPKKEATM